jgi:hypothetical protein
MKLSDDVPLYVHMMDLVMYMNAVAAKMREEGYEQLPMNLEWEADELLHAAKAEMQSMRGPVMENT